MGSGRQFDKKLLEDVKELVLIKKLSVAEAARQLGVTYRRVFVAKRELTKDQGIVDALAELDNQEKFLLNEIIEHKRALKILADDLEECRKPFKCFKCGQVHDVFDPGTRVKILTEMRNERNDYKKCLQDLGILRQKKDKPKKDKIVYISRLGKEPDVPAVPAEPAVPPEIKQEEGQNETVDENAVADTAGASVF